ncbi:Kinesin-like protein KIN-7H [Frankliniella fusca]|uniref:Kinesin-like protein KIN-7H n=1 Tax=Frankliniella fusca TaxID=407009 RepID=A0AAE1L741_9NEOP|nr:Kinesin-like protein KIN-7H [Frankliniella fusca]
MGCATLATHVFLDRIMTFVVDKDITSFHKEICRLCGQREPSMWNLFEACDNNGNLNLPEKIFTCLNIMVEIGDGLPDQICAKCMTVIRCFFEFRQQCLSQDAMLRKSLLAVNMLKMGGCQMSTKTVLSFSENQSDINRSCLTRYSV